MLTKEQSNFIKLVGIAAMLFDHVGAFLYPSLLELRVIGRIAFPIFAYQLTVGYSMSPSKKDYFLRLIYFGLIAQVPYYFLREEFKLNILFCVAGCIGKETFPIAVLIACVSSVLLANSI